MKIVVSPNPYRDKQFKHARQACQILKEAGAEVSLCLPFDVDRSFEIPSDLRFREIQKEIRTADMLICFGGDGTILHSSKIATEHGLPILGVNIGTMGFMAELESGELKALRRLADGDYTMEERMMLHVKAERDGVLGVDDGIGKGLGLLFGQAQHEKREPLCALAADAGQARELLNELFERRGKVFHGLNLSAL